MEEQIYQDVWCHVFAAAWQWTSEHQNAPPATCEVVAGGQANLAAAAAVRQWHESKRLAAITAKNKEGK